MLHVLCRRRWKGVGKRLLVTFSLPFLCLLGIGLALNAPILYGNVYYGLHERYVIPYNLDELKLLTAGFFFLWSIVFFLIALVNIILFLKEIPAVYYDMLRGVKKRISFSPEPYTILDHYYLKTGIPGLPYVEVSYEDYYSAGGQTCYLDILPRTKQLLALIKHDGNSIALLS